MKNSNNSSRKLWFRTAVCTVWLLMGLFPSRLISQSGANDPTFNPTDQGFGFGDGVRDGTGSSPYDNPEVLTSALQSDGKIIIGGDFKNYNGVWRYCLARLNADGSLDTDFSYDPGYKTYAIAIQSDGKIIISTTGHRLNADGSIDTSFDPGTWVANGEVRTIGIQSNGKIIIGGDFTSYNGVGRNGIARLNEDGSLDTSFDPGTGIYFDPDGGSAVATTAIQSDGKIIIGGSFTSYNGTGRNGLARLNADGSLDASFNSGTGLILFFQNISFPGSASVIVNQSDGKIIIGGIFTSYNGTGRNHIARLNADGSLDAGFNPGTGIGPNDGYGPRVHTAVIQSDGKIIIGGHFKNYNGTSRNHIARLNVNGSLDAYFNPGAGVDYESYEPGVNTAVIQSDGQIIIGGGFTSYNNTGRNNISRLNSNGSLDPSFNWGTGANGTVLTTSIQSDGKSIIGGSFTNYNYTGVGRNHIARVNTDGTLDTGFDPGIGSSGDVNTTSIQSDGKIIIGGSFSSFNGTNRNNISRLNANGSLDAAFNPGTGANNAVITTAIQSDGKTIIGGSFTSYNGTGRNRIARLNTNGSLDTGFKPGNGPQGGANNTVWTAVIQSNGKIIIGGDFTSYSNTNRNRVARLNANGSLDTGFNPGTGANGTVYTSALQSDGKIIIGGSFTSYNGTGRNRVARLNANGSLDTSFNPGTGTNGNIHTITIQSDGKIIIGGDFTDYNSTGRNRLARFNTNGSLDTSFDPETGAGKTVRTTAKQGDGNIVVGGDFTSYNGTGRNRLARVLTATPPAAAPTITEGLSGVYLTNAELDVFPNPASDEIHINLHGRKDVSELVITDQLGKIVWARKPGGGEKMVNVDLSGISFVNGIYFISTISGGEKLTRQFVIAK